MEYTDFLRKITLENAIRYNGTANPKSLLGKVIGTYPEKKTDTKSLLIELEIVAKEVNALSLDVQKAEFEKLGGADKKEEKKKDDLKDLKDAEHGKVVMRFAPSVSAPHMHLGHAITGGLTSLYCKKYNGKFIFRMEDTNSDKIESEAYTLFPQEAKWIFGNVSEVVIQSDRLELYYSYARKFLELGHMYACECSSEKFKAFADAKEDCPCRSAEPVIQLQRFEKMFDKENGYKEGEVVLRFKAGMTHPNPAMRDFPLMRINDTPHGRTGTKYRVWPLMNFSVFVDDVEFGMTHIIRAKEHMDNAKRQELLYDALGKKPPVCYFTGRYNIEGLEISKTKTKLAIDEGKYTGWDDIRLPFLGPMRRRGYQPGAFWKFSASVGLSPVDKSITAEDFFKTLDAFNKEIIDPIATRHYFIEHPALITCPGLKQTIHLGLHPDRKDQGGRAFTINENLLIEKSDLANISEGMMVRLMDLANVILEGKAFKVVSTDYDSYKNFNGKKMIIHWLPADDAQTIQVDILMPDAKRINGIAEKHVELLKEDAVIQFERFGFVRLDSIKDQKREFWYAHR